MRFLIPLLFAVGFAIPLHALESTAVDDGSVSAPILLGRVGAYAGTVDGALVTAGGVQNGAEPDAMILVTETGKDGNPVSRPADAVLPTGRAYGASVSTEDAFYLIGGAEGPTLRPIADCCKITRDKGSGTALRTGTSFRYRWSGPGRVFDRGYLRRGSR